MPAHQLFMGCPLPFHRGPPCSESTLRIHPNGNLVRSSFRARVFFLRVDNTRCEFLRERRRHAGYKNRRKRKRNLSEPNVQFVENVSIKMLSSIFVIMLRYNVRAGLLYFLLSIECRDSFLPLKMIIMILNSSNFKILACSEKRIRQFRMTL